MSWRVRPEEVLIEVSKPYSSRLALQKPTEVMYFVCLKYIFNKDIYIIIFFTASSCDTRHVLYTLHYSLEDFIK